MKASKQPLDYSRQTVLITGASAGLGAEFARQLAARGSDLVLVARRADRLEQLAAQLERDHDTTVVSLPMDLARPGVGRALERELDLRGVQVTSVVNSAGFANLGRFHELDLPSVLAEVAVDVSAVVEISHAFLPRLRQRGDGFLLNVASMAAYQGNPTMAVYGAGKAFVLSLTEALWYEARDTGLRVLALSPGATDTEFFDVAGSRADGGSRRVSAEAVVATALGALERRNPPPSVIAGGSNRLSEAVGRILGRRRMAELIGALMTRPSTRG
ncbi:SDR family NAD(P)-dependent oxidoreductase [Agromyces sp. CFH 90414]|uniref:SDR family NAD(P)-dependent oxidoreductase n=1 Tax=Agromyces agglutinans TaxID=2662258 RepID=A0A6I2F9G7_9MICO|nr:SDR family oxidoreductase [Agromyces agglutinans]MRG59360.1 SDR family NAD(P)-dependent oxidoreductase [Agromyces agglutinans]